MSDNPSDWDTMLPQGSDLGALRIALVPVHYDRPVLFVCMSDTGQRYLFVLLDEADDDDIWLVAPVSAARMQDLIRGEVDLHTAFTQPEGGSVYTIGARDTMSTQRDPASLTPDELPVPGAFLCH